MTRIFQTVKKASQNFPRKRKAKFQWFSPAACTWAKTLLRLQVWNLSVKDRQIMRAADCKELTESPEGDFRQAQPRRKFLRGFAYWKGYSEKGFMSSLIRLDL